jgi:prevent-host-death family protein
MKTITIRELHERTGEWVREARRYGQITVTDHGKIVAKIVPEIEQRQIPYFARRKVSPEFEKLSTDLKVQRGTDATVAISEDREDRYV